MRAVVVGLGGRSGIWVETCRKVPGVELVGCVEPVEAVRNAKTEHYGLDPAQVFGTLADAVDAVAPDFIVDVTPPRAHESVARQAFEAGLHVLGEKPLSDDFAAAQRIVAAAQAAGVTHMITQNYRFAAPPRTLQRLVAESAVGTVGEALVTFFMPWADLPGSHYVTQPYMHLTDMGIHHFDLIRCVLGVVPKRVLCTTWNEPWGWHAGDASHVFCAECECGVRITHVACGCSVGKRTSWNGEWQIEGSAGSLTLEDNHVFITHQHRTDQPRRDEIPLDDVASGTEAVMAEFVTAIAEGRPPECHSADNLHSLAMVFAGIESAKTGRWVELGELG